MRAAQGLLHHHPLFADHLFPFISPQIDKLHLYSLNGQCVGCKEKDITPIGNLNSPFRRKLCPAVHLAFLPFQRLPSLLIKSPIQLSEMRVQKVLRFKDQLPAAAARQRRRLIVQPYNAVRRIGVQIDRQPFRKDITAQGLFGRDSNDHLLAIGYVVIVVVVVEHVFDAADLKKLNKPGIELGQIEPVLHCRKSSHLVCFLSLSSLCPFRKIRIFRPLFVSERYAVMLHNPEFSSC